MTSRISVRSVTAALLMVSLLAMSSSGLLMLVVDQPSFTLRMHPVHKLFGLLMVAAACVHLALNRRALQAHLARRSTAMVGVVAVLALAAAYAVVALNPVPEEDAALLDEAARRIEAREPASAP